MSDGIAEHDEPSNGSWEAEIGSIRVLFGAERLGETGDLVRGLGCRRVLVVSDPGLAAAGHLDALVSCLAVADLEVDVFTDVGENPTTEQVSAGFTASRSRAPEAVVALGGGSAMDCAKGINFLLCNGGEMQDYVGFGRAERPLLPAIGIPTTAGTGSEAQSYALISDAATHRKLACGDFSARFRVVILDPTLLASVPAPVAAAAGLDAVSHAVESHVSTRHNPISRLFSRQAWHLLDQHLEASLQEGASLVDRGAVQLAAHLAGAAIEQSMLGAAHACANPLTARYDLAHGRAVAMMLPHVVRFNGGQVGDHYRDLAGFTDPLSADQASRRLADRIEQLRGGADLPTRLTELGVSPAEIPALAAAANSEWTARFNPRPLTQEDFETLYEAAL